MNLYCQSVFQQMDMAIDSVLQMIGTLREEDLAFRPTANKMSVGELLAHLAVLCEADYLIGAGASEEEMDLFYVQSEPAMNCKALQHALTMHYAALKQGIAGLSDEELFTHTTAFWGGVHSRFEWLLDTQAHFYHHRGQLHAMLVHSLKHDPGVRLFE
ncbi:DinB family protein [Paenibacillus hunanensis]|uniref:DinB family protein n=1 Tax=Paenibacillus hunanensis TaxID=539262 RepID=UPI002A6B10FD|nr:DinB family protein [Paenibacillus hunanensis]WPP41166.1 DinB family protein [Paenibacillus hunanensis]